MLRPENLTAGLPRGEIARTAAGEPMVWSGSFSSQYRFQAASGDSFAVRVFHPPTAAEGETLPLGERLPKVEAHLENVRHPAAIQEPRYVEEGIRVNGRSLPVVVTPWVGTPRLDRWISSSVRGRGRPGALRQFAQRWRQLMREMRAAEIAHGNLQTSTVGVDPASGQLDLSQYDAMWVPSLRGTVSDHLGHPSYQHPSYFARDRSARAFGPELDNFSSLVIYVSALAIEHDPGLWDQFHRTEGQLIFNHEDFRDPAGSPAFRAVVSSPNRTVRALGEALAAYCTGTPDAVPDLDRAIARATRGIPAVDAP